MLDNPRTITKKADKSLKIESKGCASKANEHPGDKDMMATV